MITKNTTLAQATTVGLMATMVLSGTGAVLAQPSVASAQTTTATSVTFTRDLTIGSSGADVIALQNWLISKGFTIPAGATGYFGGQTQAALARYQASVGIAPASGYFGPITRGKVNTGTPTTPTNPDTSNVLKGDEADLSGYNLRREETSGNEGEEEVQIATAEFDVEDGDIRVERMDLMVEGTNNAYTTQPWKYFDRIAVLADGKEIADKDVNSRSDWKKSGNGYRLSLTGMKHIVRKGDSAELTIVADIAQKIDSNNLAQTFTFKIEDQGIRAVDAKGIQQYVGNNNKTVTFGFDAEESGDLRISRASDNPKASILVSNADRESGEYDVFAFDIKNRDNVDSLVTDLAISVTNLNGGVQASDVIRRATLEVGRDRFQGDVKASTIEFKNIDLEVDGDDEANAVLVIRLARNATSTPIAFSINTLEAEGVKSGDTATVNGSATSEMHTIASTGVALASVSTAQSAASPGNDVSASYGSYTIKFSVTGLEDDAYIASTTASAGTVGVLYEVGANTFSGSESAVLTSTARMQNGYYLVREGSTETFTLTVTLNPDAAGIFDVRLKEVRFNNEASMTDSATFTVANDSEYRTNPIYIAN